MSCCESLEHSFLFLLNKGNDFQLRGACQGFHMMVDAKYLVPGVYFCRVSNLWSLPSTSKGTPRKGGGAPPSFPILVTAACISEYRKEKKSSIAAECFVEFSLVDRCRHRVIFLYEESPFFLSEPLSCVLFPSLSTSFPSLVFVLENLRSYKTKAPYLWLIEIANDIATWCLLWLFVITQCHVQHATVLI